MKPEELYELFSIEQNSKGAIMFTVLFYVLAGGMDGPRALAHLCKLARMPRPAVYSRMKQALAPVFDADAATLKALGLRPQQTTLGLARELIRSMNGGEADGKL